MNIAFMMMRLLFINCLLLFSIGLSYGQTSQSGTHSMPRPVAVGRHSTYSIPIVYQLHDGIARLTDGSQLQGRFLYNKGGSSFTYYANGHDDRKRIYFLQFERLALAGADTSVTPRLDSTLFLHVKNNLLRRLTIGKVDLYDQIYSINENKNKIGDVLFAWNEDGKLKRLRNLEQLNKWFYTVCLQNHWPNPDVFLSKTEVIKRLAQLDPTP